VIERLTRAVGVLCNLLMWAGCFVGFLMMLHIVADVTGRVLFNHPLESTIEIVSGYYMVAVAFLPLGYIAATEGHIIVELFTRGLSRRGQLRLDGVVNIVTFAYMTMFAWQTGAEAVAATRLGEVWETSTGFVAIWPSRWMLPVGCGLMAAYLLLRVVHDLREAQRG